jgi:hypothetical protein
VPSDHRKRRLEQSDKRRDYQEVLEVVNRANWAEHELTDRQFDAEEHRVRVFRRLRPEAVMALTSCRVGSVSVSVSGWNPRASSQASAA